MSINSLIKKVAVASMLVVLVGFGSPVLARSCTEESAEIKAKIATMPSSADRNLAQTQYDKAQERLAAGKEKSCLRYLNSARSAIEAFEQHDD